MMDELHIYMCFHFASTKSIAGNRTRFFLSPFLIPTSSFLILAKAFRNDYVDTCSTAVRSDTEMNDVGGYQTVPCTSKMTQRSSPADLPKF